MNTLQNGVTVKDGVISGTLKYVTDYTQFSSDPALQQGNYLAVKFEDIDPSATSVKVGIEPGTPAAEIINDPDKNGVFRILNPATNKLVITVTDGEHTEVQKFALSGLTLEPAPNEESEAEG